MKLVPKEKLEEYPEGSVVIKNDTLFHGEDSDQKKKILAHQYTKLVQENPEYDFGILMDNEDGTVTVSWKRRE